MPEARSFLTRLPGRIAEGMAPEELYRLMLAEEPDVHTAAHASEKVAFLAERWSQTACFVPIRLLERFDDLVLEHDETYILAMISALGDRYHEGVREHMLRTDPELREELIWRIFTVEGGGEVSLTNVDKFSRPDATWKASILMAAFEGVLPRERLLRECVAALARDFSAYRAGWFSALLTALEPTADELLPLQAPLIRLLNPPIQGTVSAVMKLLAPLAGDDRFDRSAFLTHADGALRGTAGTAELAIRSLRSGAAAEADEERELVDALLASALEHPGAAVQRRAASALIARGREDLVRSTAESLSPALVRELAAVLGADEEPEAGAGTGADAEAGARAGAPADEPASSGRTDGASRLEIPSDSDAVALLVRLLEEPADVLATERVLAWSAAHPDPAPLLEPLARRAWSRRSSLSRIPAALILAATSHPESEALVRALPRIGPLGYRAQEVCSILSGQAPRRPLLALPTWSDGRIDPSDLRARISAAGAATALPEDARCALNRIPGASRTALAELLGCQVPAAPTPLSATWRHESWGYRVEAEPAPESVWFETAAEAQLWVQELGLDHPHDPAPLVAAGLLLLRRSLDLSAPRAEETLLDLLRDLPSPWPTQTAQILGMACAASRSELRTAAAEHLLETVPARLDVSTVAAQWAIIAPACVLTRWAGSLRDAASISPQGAALVRNLLTALLPRLDPGARGIGSVLEILLDESIRTGARADEDALDAWLSSFRGSSAAARAAKALLSLRAEPGAS